MGFAARLQDNVTIMAGAAIRRTETVTELRRAIYTPCNVCKEDKVTPKTPTWSIQASKIVQDHDHQVIYYKRRCDPRAWACRSSTPRSSGTRTPRPSGARGSSPPRSATPSGAAAPTSSPTCSPCRPRRTSSSRRSSTRKVNPFVSAEYEKRFYSGTLDIRGGYTHDQHLQQPHQVRRRHQPQLHPGQRPVQLQQGLGLGLRRREHHRSDAVPPLRRAAGLFQPRPVPHRHRPVDLADLLHAGRQSVLPVDLGGQLPVPAGLRAGHGHQHAAVREQQGLPRGRAADRGALRSGVVAARRGASAPRRARSCSAATTAC